MPSRKHYVLGRSVRLLTAFILVKSSISTNVALIPAMAQLSQLQLHRVYFGCLYVCTYHYNWCVHPISHCIYLTFFSRLLSLATMKTKRKMYPTSPEPTSITCTPTLQLTTSFTILVGMPFLVITPYESLSRSWRLPTGRWFNVQGRSSSSTSSSLASKYVFPGCDNSDNDRDNGHNVHTHHQCFN